MDGGRADARVDARVGARKDSRANDVTHREEHERGDHQRHARGGVRTHA